MRAALGLPDVEAEVAVSLSTLRCAPWLPSYIAALASPGRMGAAASLPLGLPGHQLGAVNQGMNFRSPFRWGLAGTYTDWAYLGAWDRVAHAAQHNVVAVGRRVGRVWGWVGGGFFAPL